ncbi:hypothetical protein [Baekduia sp.]|uniref:hypothetical protein n=1 Tax=Baekduia sp. TaxID=2600305 RepID=UPI002D1FAE67|nr:hypothetical protein [Baekduia sp.]
MPPVAAALATLAALPALAYADAPWSPPAALPGAGDISVSVAMTASGASAVLTWADRSHGTPATPSLLTPVGSDGSLGTPVGVDLFDGRAVGFGGTGYALAGGSTVDHRAIAGDQASVVVGLGSVDRGLGPIGKLPGTKGQVVLDLAADARGDVALVTGKATGSRSVWRLLAGGHGFRRVLDIPAGATSGHAAVAVGTHGETLVAWSDDGELFARDVSRKGAVGMTARLGPGRGASIDAAVDGTGRRLVAWDSQTVDEGEPTSPAVTRFATAKAGRPFGTTRTLETIAALGTGHYVHAPGVRLVLDGGSRALLAWTGHDATTFVVKAAEVVGGRVGASAVLSPAGTDAVLGDAATDPAGAATVLWRAGVAGSDSSGPLGGPRAVSRVFASVRAAGATTFGRREAISDPAVYISESPAAAIDPTNGRSLAVFPSGTAIVVATRPAG